MKQGTQIWVTGSLRQTQRIYDDKLTAYEEMPVYKQVHSDHRIDLIGVNVGMDRIIPMCRDFGLSVLQPLNFEDSVRAVYHFKPLLVMIKWPGFDTEQSKLEERCKVGAEVCAHQSESGRLFLCEAPPLSPAWTASEKVAKLLHLKDVTTNECDAAAYGAETEDNQPASRAHRWVTNSALVAGKLTRKLNEEFQTYCQTNGEEGQRERRPRLLRRPPLCNSGGTARGGTTSLPEPLQP